MKDIDWNEVEHVLYRESEKAIRGFASEHPKATCSFFAFDSEPYYGYVILALDTIENSRQAAKATEQDAIKTREKMLSEEWSWKNAKYYTSVPPITDYGANVGDFEFAQYKKIQFKDWQRFADSADYPKSEESEDDYLEGNLRVAIWRVVEKLIQDRLFDALKLCSPFRIGYQYHDQEMVVLRILNWKERI